MHLAVVSEHGGPTPLPGVIAALVCLIGVCTGVACILAIMQFQESKASRESVLSEGKRRITEDPTSRFPQKPPPPISSAITTMRKRSKVPEKGAAGPRRWGSDTSSPMMSASGFLDGNSMVHESQELMDSAMVQEILGSVDMHHVHETQVLLHSFKWDMDELLQSELDILQGRRAS